MATKDVKITFHTLIQRMWKLADESENKEQPFFLVGEVLDHIGSIKSKDKTQKFYELKDKKFCFIDTVNKASLNNDDVVYYGIFKSARSDYRPNLINRKTGTERKNPKEITEGDIEKTHFLVKLSRTDNEVYLFMEKNFMGVSPVVFVNYITHFTVLYLQHIDEKRNFSILRTDIPMNNFLTEVERLSRTVTAEVYFDKKLLGSGALNFSNRTVSLKRDLVLTAKASSKESITEVGVDLWNKMQHKDSPISRVRIKGIDENDNAVLLDTSFFCRQEFITVELNADTGEVNSTQLLSRLQNLAKDF
jgi:hypothetical protein